MNISNRKAGRKLHFAPLALSVAVAAGLAAGVRIAGAANVSGLMSYPNGKPAEHRWLHYENRVTSDIYIAPTTPDGSFTADLPPGLYDLRAERGVILASKIRVDSQDVYIGHVVEPAPLDVRRPFESEGVAESIVESAAPATANLGGRPLGAMMYGHEVMAPLGAPGTPAPRSTPLGEATPVAAASPSTIPPPSGKY
ncbi:MAG: hypothetical protein ABSB13_02285 [Candidatus Binatus sp.]|jgi:hypothetical protein|uniref:hypothetical protein n=1 Tax=Candidatus Binatus sp. TaxID=2811406 RepID=UPI003D126DB7